VQHLVDRVLACEVSAAAHLLRDPHPRRLPALRRAGVDVLVIEAGLGGRLDATRIGHYVARLFTPIDLDHTAYLGPDVAAIASEKAAVLE
jgi:hypothetical protein